METGKIYPVASMVDAGSQPQPKVQDTTVADLQKDLQSAGAQYISLAQTRLVIEMDGDSGGWVYQTVDANNGHVLAQYPLRSAWEIILSKRSGLGLGVMIDAKA